MFWRKIDSFEQQAVREFIKLHVSWSKEIDTQVDKVKIAFVGMDSTSTRQEVLKLVGETLETVRNVESKAMNKGNWPKLHESKGSSILAELWLQRASTFKHQIWRLSTIGRIAKASAYEEQALMQEAIEATSEYENSVNEMAKVGIKLLKRYKIPVQEVFQMMM